jgi:large repetitive protein
MVKNSGIPSIFCLAMLMFLQSNSCTSCAGIPSDFNKVILHATSTQLSAGQSTTITATVPKDTTGEGVTWVFTPGMNAPTPPGTFTVNSVTSATYAAPTTAVAAQFTVSIQATSIAFPSEVNTIIITIAPTAPMQITTTSLPNGVANQAYPSTQLQATGGVPPYTWALTSAAGTLDGLTLNPNGTITGTPTAVGVFNAFTVQVSDSETPTPMTATTTAGQLSITVTNLLSGSYAFELSGFNAAGPYMVAGSFAADGVSKISGGFEDVDSIQNGPSNSAFTGSFTLTGDNRGQLVFSSLAGSPTYDFSIDPTGAHGRIVEFDSTGVRGSGQIELQSAATCANSTLSGAGPLGANWVIGVSGATGNFSGVTPGPMAMVGRFTAEVPASNATPGNIDTGEVDINDPQTVFTMSPTFSGTFGVSQQAARCAMSLTTPASTMDFAVYPITSTSGVLTEAFVVETDSLSASAPFVTAGKMIQQVGYPFTTPSNTMSGPSVGGLLGSVIPTGQTLYLPFVGVSQLNPNGGLGFTLQLFENIGGSRASFTGSDISIATNNNDSFGRFDTTLVTPISPVFYVIGPNEAFCILENLQSPVLGIFEPQSTGGFTTTSIAGTFVAGTATPNTSLTTDFSGVATLASTGTSTDSITATEDISASGGNTGGQAVTGTNTLSGTGATDGTGSVSLNLPPGFTGQSIVVSSTKIVLISTTPGDVNPVLVILGNCVSTCGED